MLIVSYYTKNTPYEKVMFTQLFPTIKKWDLDYDIETIDDLGSWQLNTHYKATFLKKMLLKHKQPIVFLDSDSTIEKNPVLFTELSDYDISYHELDWFLQWRGKSGEKREILSGTLYLNYTEKTLSFLDAWIAENNRNTNWEQRNMADILQNSNHNLKVYALPYSYITILLHNNKIPSHIKPEEVYILHHQASRKYKKR